MDDNNDDEKHRRYAVIALAFDDDINHNNYNDNNYNNYYCNNSSELEEPKTSNMLLSSSSSSTPSVPTMVPLSSSTALHSSSSSARRCSSSKPSRSTTSTSIDAMTPYVVGAIAVAGIRSQNSVWDDDVSDSTNSGVDHDYDEVGGRQDGAPNELIQPVVSVDDINNGPLPMAQIVKPRDNNSVDEMIDSIDKARENLAMETREAMAAEVPHAEPVLTIPVRHARCRTITLLLLIGFILPLMLAAIGIVIGVVRRRHSAAVHAPTVASPTTLDSMAPRTTYSPSNSPIVLLQNGRKAFTTTTQLRSAVDEYCFMLQSNMSKEEMELSDVASEYGYPIGTWDVSRIVDFSRAFDPDRSQSLVVDHETTVQSLFDEDLSGWDVSNAVTMEGMFHSANSFTGQGLENWDVGKVTDFSFLFANTNKFNGNISMWNTSSAIRMDAMFVQSQIFNGDLSLWDVSRVSSMSSMFNSAIAFKGGDLRKWNVGNVVDMDHMFSFSAFNGKVSTWDTSKVVNMEAMFWWTELNDDLSLWSVGKVQTMHAMFCEAKFFHGGNLNQWNTSSVKHMSKMFMAASSFQGNISQWNVSNVENFESMFQNADSFTGYNISLWDTRKAKSMAFMFAEANSFNCDLSAWSVYGVTDTSSMFSGASSFDQNLCSWGEQLTDSTMIVQMFASSSCPNQNDPSTVDISLGPFCRTCSA